MKHTNKSRLIIKQTSIWQYLLLLSVLVSSVVYALPNIYGHDPSIAISNHKFGAEIQSTIKQDILETFDTESIEIKSTEMNNNRYLIRFHDVDTQFKAFDSLNELLANSYSITYVLASRSPEWLTAIGAAPMQLGLDLQGGIHLLYEVDMEEALDKAEERYIGEYRLTLQNADIRYKNIEHFKLDSSRGIMIDFKTSLDRDAALTLLSSNTSELKFSTSDTGNSFTLIAAISKDAQKSIKQHALKKNISTLRNRANELGVSEPIVHKQGENRIVVELPGVQDPDRVREILGSTATLEFRLVHER